MITNKFIGILTSSLIVGSGLVFSGCAAKKDITIEHDIIVHKTKPYQFKLKPQIGTRQEDARTVVDMGVVLKISINSYKNRNNDLIGGHDIFVWGRKPDFIPSTNLPKRSSYNVITSNKKLPFYLSNDGLDNADLSKDETIRKFTNELYKMEKSKELANKKHEKSLESDKKILDFLKKMKNTKGDK